ncbi:hypothetical protein AVEN_194237-1 [Araneus ventricosus]|uniref:Uncharacterized protein n=1 Tax=Araneus ventricosus TaxID=182803 RepID=A0A4Y2HGT8_ARAVE|nr:hypothetical protein AVEN_194237-1 [Araneus ventricosus]
MSRLRGRWIPLTIRRVCGPVSREIIHRGLKSPPMGWCTTPTSPWPTQSFVMPTEDWRGGCQFRCRLHQLTEVQNCEVHPNIALELFQI